MVRHVHCRLWQLPFYPMVWHPKAIGYYVLYTYMRHTHKCTQSLWLLSTLPNLETPSNSSHRHTHTCISRYVKNMYIHTCTLTHSLYSTEYLVMRYVHWSLIKLNTRCTLYLSFAAPLIVGSEWWNICTYTRVHNHRFLNTVLYTPLSSSNCKICTIAANFVGTWTFMMVCYKPRRTYTHTHTHTHTHKMNDVWTDRLGCVLQFWCCHSIRCGSHSASSLGPQTGCFLCLIMYSS